MKTDDDTIAGILKELKEVDRMLESQGKALKEIKDHLYLIFSSKGTRDERIRSIAKKLNPRGDGHAGGD